MIYLDNAATTLRKPPCVIDAVVRAMTTLGRLRHLPLAMTPDGPAAQQGALRLFFPPAPGGYALALCMEE